MDLPFRLTEEDAESLRRQFGTPLYVLSEGHMRSRARRYLNAMRQTWPNSEVNYASKANSTLAVLVIMASEGLGIDVASEGELRAAMAAGIMPSRCHFHGNNKSRHELEFAISVGVGMIMVDNFGELEQLIDLRCSTKLALRLSPGVDPITHEKISTGQSDTKFGFNIADGSAESAVKLTSDHHLNLVGIHCHVGSNLFDPQAQRDGGSELAIFLKQVERRHGLHLSYLNVGGGLGVSYTEADKPMDIEAYCAAIAESVRSGLNGFTPEPTLAQEPGRSLVGEAGVTLYSVGVIKDVPTASGRRRYVVVDGGLADNPRPALYGAKYTVLPTHTESSDGGVEIVRVSGRHCESDLLFDDVPLPTDLKRGDLLQVLCTGAYNASMASNYNRYPRPRSVMLMANGRWELVQEADSFEDMVARERIPSSLAGVPS